MGYTTLTQVRDFVNSDVGSSDEKQAINDLAEQLGYRATKGEYIDDLKIHAANALVTARVTDVRKTLPLHLLNAAATGTIELRKNPRLLDTDDETLRLDHVFPAIGLSQRAVYAGLAPLLPDVIRPGSEYLRKDDSCPTSYEPSGVVDAAVGVRSGLDQLVEAFVRESAKGEYVSLQRIAGFSKHERALLEKLLPQVKEALQAEPRENVEALRAGYSFVERAAFVARNVVRGRHVFQTV